MKKKADYTLDFRGIISPVTLLKVSSLFKKMKPDEVFEILGRDPDTRTFLFKILPEGAFELVEKSVLHDVQLYYRIRIKKVKSL